MYKFVLPSGQQITYDPTFALFLRDKEIVKIHYINDEFIDRNNTKDKFVTSIGYRDWINNYNHYINTFKCIDKNNNEIIVSMYSSNPIDLYN